MLDDTSVKTALTRTPCKLKFSHSPTSTYTVVIPLTDTSPKQTSLVWGTVHHGPSHIQSNFR